MSKQPGSLNKQKSVKLVKVTLKKDPSVSTARKELKKVDINKNGDTENFQPGITSGTSNKPKNKLDTNKKSFHEDVKKLKNTGEKLNSALYDANGIHIASGKNICDCLMAGCSGCFYPCEKCGSSLCGLVCRCNRDFVYEEVMFEGSNLFVKFEDTLNNPL